MSSIKSLLLLFISFYSVFSSATYLNENVFVDHELVSKTLMDPSSRYYKALSKVAPLVLRKVEGGGSATVFAKSIDGQGLVLTALHIQRIKFLNTSEILGLRNLSDWSFELQPIHREDNYPVKSVIDGLKDSEHVIPVLGGFTMYKPNTQIRDKKVNIEWYPKSDFALIALPQVNAWYLDVPSDPSMGTLPTLFPGKYSSEPLTAIKLDYLKIASPNEGAEVILVGFPRKNDIDPSIQNRLEMRNGQSYSTGT
ncbi:MAG: hypothetical protein L6Q37_11875, partial [Bdellovibrionaceae bacterium]|nr:hypothetical protein [Pseudobdellovibrionaceae bacterium]